MSERPNFAGVLAEHVPHGGAWGGTTPGWNAHCLGCDWTARGAGGGMWSAIDAHRAHLAAALNAEVDRWLAGEETRERVAEGVIDGCESIGVNDDISLTDGCFIAESALAALIAHRHDGEPEPRLPDPGRGVES